jgi:hypothetical protein
MPSVEPGTNGLPSTAVITKMVSMGVFTPGRGESKQRGGDGYLYYMTRDLTKWVRTGINIDAVVAYYAQKSEAPHPEVKKPE